MGDGIRTAVAFGGALMVALAATPLLRRIAVAHGVVDQPAARKVHGAPTPYLGGVAIMVGALFGLMIGGELLTRTAVLAAGAIALGVVGLMDDRHTLSPAPRLVAQVAAALLAVSVGVRAEVFGNQVLDVAITILWIVGITNALNLLDNMDGLAGGVAAVCGSACIVLATLAEQQIVAEAAAALVGACLGFLVYNRRPASIFMGDAGSLFLGYVLAIVALSTDPTLHRPANALVPLALLALPVLDTSMVVIERRRNGRSIATAGKDHVSHRLVARGLAPGRAVLSLIVFEGAVATLAVLGGRDVLPMLVVVGGAGLLAGGLAAVTVRAPVYPSVPDRDLGQS